MNRPADGPRGRVLVVLHEEAIGGATLAVLRCIPGLRERGWEFTFWVPPGPAFAELERRGERVGGVRRPHAYSLAALRLEPGVAARLSALPRYGRALRARIREEAPVLVHANSHVTLADAIIARRIGVPTLVHIHEMFGSGPKWDIGRRLVRRYATEAVAVSEACADALECRGRRPRVVLNGVEMPAPVERVAERPFTVGTVAAIARRKGIDVLVEAARRVREREPSVQFEIVGAASDPLDAGWAKEVLAEAKRIGIRHVERDDVGAALARWDLFALASRRDPFPLSSLEAMASGLPVVASAVDGLPEQVTPETGRLVPPEDPRALAEAILELAAMGAAKRAAIGAAARARVEERFTIPAQVEGLDAAYLAAARGSQR